MLTLKQNIMKKQNYGTWIVIYIKTGNIYEDIVEDVETDLIFQIMS